MTPDSRPTAGRASGLRWLGATLVVALAACAIPLAWFGRYYFVGDSQIGAFPQWAQYGHQLLAGHWPLLDPSAWQGGNYAAEGQFGLLSPITTVLALAAAKSTSAVVFSTVVKTVFSVIGATGAYALARSYGVRPSHAFVAGGSVVLAGGTQYLDQPSWVTGLMVWSLLPWCWWALRRTALRGANPLPLFVLAYLLVSIGYVYGTIYLGFLLVATFVDAARSGQRGAKARVAAAGIVCALMSVVVYLPGVLTSPVTTRDATTITNTTDLTVQLTQYLSSMIATQNVPVDIQAYASWPVGYIAWFLPIVAWVDPRRLGAALRPLVGLLGFLLVVALWSLGPTVIGPLRYPARLLPAVALPVILLAVVLLDHAVDRPGRRRLVLAVAVASVGGYLTASRFLPKADVQVGTVGVVVVGLVLTWWVIRRRGRLVPATVAVLIVVWGLGLQGVQHSIYPIPPALDFHMSADTTAYPRVLAGAEGDVLALGDQFDYLKKHADTPQQILIGTSWYLTGRPVANIYSTIGYTTYDHRLCLGAVGTTCPDGLRAVLGTEPTTGRTRLDLLAVGTLLLWKPSFPAAELREPPAGWHEVRQSTLVVMWVRDHQVAGAGGPVATSAGTSVTAVHSSARSVTVRVDQVPDSGGTVTFSRLAWPGYVATGASLAPSVDGYLLTAAVPAGSAGRTLTLRFTPPGWSAGLGALALAWTLGLGWSAGALLRRRRRRRVTARPSPGSVQPDPAREEAPTPRHVHSGQDHR